MYYLLVVLTSWNINDNRLIKGLENNIDIIESMIEYGVKDANNEGRSNARLCFHAYNNIFEDRGNILYNSLDNNVQILIDKDSTKFVENFSGRRFELKNDKFTG